MTKPNHEATLITSVYYPVLNGGMLRLSGETRADFLQRQTTNDIRQLGKHRALLTVLTSPQARILDVLMILHSDDFFDVITLPGRVARTALFLRNRVFFADHVSINDDSSKWAQFWLMGPQTPALFARAGVDLPEESDRVVAGELDGVSIRVLACNSLFKGHILMVTAGNESRLTSSLQQIGIRPLSSQDFDVLRIEAGCAGAVNELNDDYTPLEVNLRRAIAENKGCYTGQEVISRQITYAKITRRLIGLSLERPAHPLAKLMKNNRQVGMITSTAVSPRLGPLALGFVTRSFATPNTQLTVVDTNSERSQAAIRSNSLSE